MRNTKIIIVLILSFLIQNCASFDEKLINPNPRNQKNLNELNGKYTIVAKNDSLNSTNQQSWIYSNFLSEIDRRVVFNVPELDSTITYYFNLKILNEKKLRIDFLNQNQVFRSETLKYKLKNNGYLYLKNKNIQPIFIPYLVGSIDISNTRLTLGKNENLILDSTNHRSGGIFIVIFMGGSNWDYRKEYRRIKKYDDKSHK